MLLEAALALIEGLAQGILDAIPVLIEALPEVIDSIVTFFTVCLRHHDGGRTYGSQLDPGTK